MNFLGFLIFTAVAVLSNDFIPPILSQEILKGNDSSEVVQNGNSWNGWPTENTVSEVTALYDHENNLTFYKDVSVPACFVEHKENPENHSVPNFLKVLAVSNSTVQSDSLIKSKFLTPFCGSLPILMIKSSDSDSLHRVHRSRRRKRCEEHDRLLQLQQSGLRSRGHGHGGHTQSSQGISRDGGTGSHYYSSQSGSQGQTGSQDQSGGNSENLYGSRTTGQTWSSSGQFLRPETRSRNVVTHYYRGHSQSTGGQRPNDNGQVVHSTSSQQIYRNGQLVKSLNTNNGNGLSIHPAPVREDTTLSNGNTHAIYTNGPQQQPVETQTSSFTSKSQYGRISVPVTWTGDGQNQNVQLKFNNNGGLAFVNPPNDQPQPYAESFDGGTHAEDYSQEYLSEGRGQKYTQNGRSHSSSNGRSHSESVQNGNGHSTILNGQRHSILLNGNGNGQPITLPPNLSGFRLVTVQPDHPVQMSNGHAPAPTPGSGVHFTQNGGNGFRQWKQSGKSVQLTVRGQAQPPNGNTGSEDHIQDYSQSQQTSGGQTQHHVSQGVQTHTQTQTQQFGSGYSQQYGGRTGTTQVQQGRQSSNGRHIPYLNELNGLTVQEAGVDEHGESGSSGRAETRQSYQQSSSSHASAQGHAQAQLEGQRSNIQDLPGQTQTNGNEHSSSYQFQHIEQSHPLVQPVVDSRLTTHAQSTTNSEQNGGGHARQSNGGVQYQQNGGEQNGRQFVTNQPQNGGHNYNRQYTGRNYGSNGQNQQHYVQTQRSSSGQYYPRQYAFESRPEEQSTTPTQNLAGRGQSAQSQNTNTNVNPNYQYEASASFNRTVAVGSRSGNGGRVQPGQGQRQGQGQCHLVTFTCTIINTANGRAKLCRPKGTNGGQPGTAVQPVPAGATSTSTDEEKVCCICCC